MKNYNLFPGINHVIAFTDMPFEKAGITDDNTVYIQKITPAGYRSYIPCKNHNWINGFEAGARYYIKMKKPLHVECLSSPTVKLPFYVRAGIFFLSLRLTNDHMREVREIIFKYLK